MKVTATSHKPQAAQASSCTSHTSQVASEEDEVLRKENAQFNLQLCTTKPDGEAKGVSKDIRFWFVASNS